MHLAGGVYNDINHFHLHVFPIYGEKQFNWTYQDELVSDNLEFDLLKSKLRSLLADFKM